MDADGARETSRQIRSALARSDSASAFRIWLTYNDLLATDSPSGRVARAALAPESTGSDLYDAALAAVTEYRLDEVGASLPSWVIDAPVLSQETVLSDSVYVRSRADLESIPEPFERRGVLFDELSLRSV